MLSANAFDRRVATLQGCALYRSHVKRAAALGLPVEAVVADAQLARCGTELEAVLWFWWTLSRVRPSADDDRIVLLTHRFEFAGGRFCPIPFAFFLVTDDTVARPGAAVFLDDPLVRRLTPPPADRSSALETGGWTVLRLARDEINRDPLASVGRCREVAQRALGALTGA
jgi:hypothetical protein